jgi:hypothetical protein
MALSESVSTTCSVVIPGELKLSNPVPPPITVPLPIVAWSHGPKNFWLGLLSFLIGALSGILFVAIWLGTSGVSLSLLDGVIFLVVLPLSLFTGVSFTGAALTCLWDAIRNGPVLEINAEGLRDHRSGLLVPWSAVRSARMLSRALSVDLQLSGPVTNWQNPFRVGVLFHRYRPKPDHVIVSIANLDVRVHILAYAIFTLTQQNDGEVISKMPGGVETYPRLIARGGPVSRRLRRDDVPI